MATPRSVVVKDTSTLPLWSVTPFSIELVVGVVSVDVVPVISVLETTSKLAAGDVPKDTWSTSLVPPGLNPEPLMTKWVPPDADPLVGMIDDTFAVGVAIAAAHRLAASPGPTTFGAAGSSGEP